MDAETSAQMHELYSRVCKAIGDPKRLLIITALRDKELSVGDLCDSLSLSQSNASQHLAVLRRRGLVTTRREGTTIYYALRSQKLVQAVDLLRDCMADISAPQADEGGSTPSA